MDRRKEEIKKGVNSETRVLKRPFICPKNNCGSKREKDKPYSS